MNDDPKTISVSIWTPPKPLWLLVICAEWYEFIPILTIQTRLFENGCVRHCPVVLDQGWICEEDDALCDFMAPVKSEVVTSCSAFDDDMKALITKIQSEMRSVPKRPTRFEAVKSQH